MQDITPEAIVVGVDTHKDVHVSVAINIAALHRPLNPSRTRQIRYWTGSQSTQYLLHGRFILLPLNRVRGVAWMNLIHIGMRHARL